MIYSIYEYMMKKYENTSKNVYFAWGARGRPFKSVHPDKDRMRVCDKQALFLYKPFANNLQTFLSNAVFRKGAINR